MEHYLPLSDSERDLIEDFFDFFQSQMQTVERLTARAAVSFQPVLMFELASVVDSLKNKSTESSFETITHLLNDFERLFFRIQSKSPSTRLEIDAALFEVATMLLDKIFTLTNSAALYGEISSQALNEIHHALTLLTDCKAEHQNETLEGIAEFLTGANQEKPQITQETIEQLKKADFSKKKMIATGEEIEKDLLFFRELAIDVDGLFPEWSGRTDILMPIVLGMNALGGNPVEYNQLQAAVYLHDVGMRDIPIEVLSKRGALNSKEKKMLHHHPAWAIENIGSMVRWNEAFWIAYQHQERCDGSGYPEGTLGNDICAGAQMIGIADTFYSIMSRNRQRSILRSIAEINACSNREFSPHWVEIFNRTIRIQQMAGGI